MGQDMVTMKRLKKDHRAARKGGERKSLREFIRKFADLGIHRSEKIRKIRGER